jgi:hypothetical protein
MRLPCFLGAILVGLVLGVDGQVRVADVRTVYAGQTGTTVQASCKHVHPTTKEAALYFMTAQAGGTVETISTAQGSIASIAVPRFRMPGFGVVGGMATNGASGDVFIYISDSTNNVVWRVDVTAKPATAEKWMGAFADTTTIPIPFTLVTPGSMAMDNSGRLWIATTGPAKLLSVPSAKTARTVGGVVVAPWTIAGAPQATIGYLKVKGASTVLYITADGLYSGEYSATNANTLHATTPLAALVGGKPLAVPVKTAVVFNPLTGNYVFVGTGLIWVQAPKDSAVVAGTVGVYGRQDGPGIYTTIQKGYSGIHGLFVGTEDVMYVFNGNRLLRVQYVPDTSVPASATQGFTISEANALAASRLGLGLYVPRPQSTAALALSISVSTSTDLVQLWPTATVASAMLKRVVSPLWTLRISDTRNGRITPHARVLVPFTVTGTRMPSQYRLSWWGYEAEKWVAYPCTWNSIGNGPSRAARGYFLICEIEHSPENALVTAVTWHDDTASPNDWRIATVVLGTLLGLLLVGLVWYAVRWYRLRSAGAYAAIPEERVHSSGGTLKPWLAEQSDGGNRAHVPSAFSMMKPRSMQYGNV